MQIEIARQFGVDLCAEIAEDWGIRPEHVPLYIGTAYYETAAAREIDDRIRDLRPGDIIVFPNRHKPNGHSAVIQSINFDKGIIRYVQSTDWVSEMKLRGPHISEISFSPDDKAQTLYDDKTQWLEYFGPTFESEECPWGDKDNGFRYRFDQFGGDYRGKVVRLKRIEELLTLIEPSFYDNNYAPGWY